MKVTYSQFFDVSSSADSFTSFTVKAGGKDVFLRCMPQFACYKYFKLGPVKVKLVPASTLPVDPTGLSYEAGESTVDPRDMFNPGLVRIINGEDICPDSVLADAAGGMNTYYATLLDPRWYKFQLQRGFSRSAVPLAYNIGEMAQDVAPHFVSRINTTPGASSNGAGLVTYPVGGTSNINPIYPSHQYYEQLIQKKLIQTGRIRLGWLPTDAVNFDTTGSLSYQNFGVNYIPESDLIKFILPKAFKTKFYYRVFVTTTVYFKEPVAVNPVVNSGSSQTFYNALDRFVTSDICNRSGSGFVLNDYSSSTSDYGKFTNDVELKSS